MSSLYNFAAGPGMLPASVKTQAQAELLNWHGTQQSIMEIGHRTKLFEELRDKIELDLRKLMIIPDYYKIIFLPGGATYQFAMLAANLLGSNKQVDYFDTGHWSQIAMREVKELAEINIVASSKASNYSHIPDPSIWKLSANAAYCHYTANETIGGLEFDSIPEVGNTPLISDMSSNILSRPIDVTKFGLIYAAAQKNAGIAGLSIIIIREDLLDKAKNSIPSIARYKSHAESRSTYNTPPVYNIYITGLVLEWIKQQGGLTAMEKLNNTKAAKLYAYIDSSNFYENKIVNPYRSKMNVVFRLPTTQLDELFIKEAEKFGLLNLKGHRVVGGIRASIYNSMPIAGVEALINFMQYFQNHYE